MNTYSQRITTGTDAANHVGVETQLSVVLDEISSGKHKERIDKIRDLTKEIKSYEHQLKECTDDKLREQITNGLNNLIAMKKEQKCSLPWATFSGRFSYVNIPGLIESAEIMCTDIDGLEDVQTAKEKLRNDPYVHVIFISPSGDGVKLLIKIPKINSTDPRVANSEHRRRYRAFKNYLHKTYAYNVDMNAQDITRLTFLSSDTNIYTTNDTVFTDITEEEIIAPDIIADGFIPDVCPVMQILTEEKINSLTNKDSGKSRNSNLDPNANLYFTNGNLYLRTKYLEKQERQESALKNWGKLHSSFSCLQIVAYCEEEGKVGRKCLKACATCKYHEEHVKDAKKEFSKKISKLKVKSVKNDLTRLQLPQYSHISVFADSVGYVLARENKFFYKYPEHAVVRILSVENKLNKKEYCHFHLVEPKEFIGIVDDYARPYTITKNGDVVNKSITGELAATILQNDSFKNKLNTVERILPVALPFIYEGKIVIPEKGYDKRFNSYSPENRVEINTKYDFNQAKQIITKIFSEFCFATEQDRTNAIALLLTPVCRGLYSQQNINSPMGVYRGNREGCGKDYCASIRQIILEGSFTEDPPLSTGMKYGDTNDELQKKITAAALEGRRLMHFSNNKGELNSAVIEGVCTSEVISGRILGKTQTVKVDNEMDFSCSGNTDFKYTADIARRIILVELLMKEEDANARTFKTPDLKGYIKSNRPEILSSLYALIREWDNAGRPPGLTPFASFHEWAKIVGGIMIFNGLGDPCQKEMQKESLEDMRVDASAPMRWLYEKVWSIHGDMMVKNDDIIKIIEDYSEEYSSMTNNPFLEMLELKSNYQAINVNDKGNVVRKITVKGKQKLGYLLKDYKERILGGIQMQRIGKENPYKYLFLQVPTKTNQGGY